MKCSAWPDSNGPTLDSTRSPPPVHVFLRIPERMGFRTSFLCLMHRRFLLTLLWALLAIATAQGQTNPNPSPTLDAYIQGEMNAERLPGAATVIVKDGRIVWMQAYGLADIGNAVPVRDTTLFLLASMSKLFTGTAAMQLHQGGQLTLDDDVNQHLPFTLTIPGFPTDPVTIRQLMTHTSSIQDNGNVMDTYYDYPDPTIALSDCMQRYFSTSGADYHAGGNFLPNAPGTVYEYSNMATALNGYVVERVSNQPFDAYCGQHIFQPLCMDKTAWFFADLDSAHIARPYQFTGGNYVPYPHYGFADYPDGQLRSNVVDLANFMIAYLNGGGFGAASILSQASINEMWTPQVPALEAGQGLNWYQEQLFHTGGSTWLWGHNGGEMGASTDMYLNPANGIGICVLTNGEGSALYICDELYDYALGLDATTGYLPACLSTGIPTISRTHPDQRPIRLLDNLGRETTMRTNTPLIRVYSDGTAERIYVFE